MDNSDFIALAALSVSILALPVSYAVATRQVRVGLDEHELRVRQRTRFLVAERLDELVELFFGGAKAIANVDLKQGRYDGPTLERNILQIESAVAETGILDRLAKSFDDYAESGDFEFQAKNEITARIKSIRGHIHRGSSSPGIFPAWEIVNLCRGAELQTLLRKQ